MKLKDTGLTAEELKDIVKECAFCLAGNPFGIYRQTKRRHVLTVHDVLVVYKTQYRPQSMVLSTTIMSKNYLSFCLLLVQSAVFVPHPCFPEDFLSSGDKLSQKNP